MTDDRWVALVRSLTGNDVARSLDDVDSLAWHVVIARESALVGDSRFPSLDGLPDSPTVAHWFDAHHIGTAAEQEVRFRQAEAMAAGLNEWEAGQ